jgi:predicted short-subunit dehydrogenase-like oxidoreductase (DUF2520 family)
MGPEREEPRVDRSSRLSRGEAFSFRPPLTVGIVGAGRVGRAFGAALLRRGHVIVSVASETLESARRAAAIFHAQPASVAGASENRDLVVIAVPDDVLGEVVAEVAVSIEPGTWVVHTSGRSGAEVLAPCGDRIAAVHPARPVPHGEVTFDGAAFGVTCSDAAWPFASWLAGELGGVPLRIDENDRVLYHAGLVLASNFTTALAADAVGLAGKDAVFPLLRATIGNLEHMDPDDALTGPVVRGDADTIRLHIKEIESRVPHLRDAYVANSRRILDRARRANKITEDKAASIDEALS